jgi:MFS transporter, FSR family, fosmidomycin resistance protein
VSTNENFVRSAAQSLFGRWKVLSIGCLAHIVHDGFTNVLYILFPVWQAQLGLNFTQVGFLKTLVSGTMASFQIPSGLLAERMGERKTLLFGTFLASLPVFFFGAATALIFLGFLLVLNGMGASVQHPVASNIISHAYRGAELRTALSIYNFSGDIGKLILPALTAFLLSRISFSSTSHVLAVVGLVAGPIIFFALRDTPATVPEASRTGQTTPKTTMQSFQAIANPAFLSLASIGLIDSATRTGFLTFLPFILQSKGGGIATTGLIFSLIFAGGAAGKFVCGVLATRVGILRTVCITEIITAVCIGCMIVLSLENSLLLAPVLGVFLNGTSSVLYGSVPELVSDRLRQRAFSTFYTITIGSGAVAPFFFGLISDFTGVTVAVSLVAVLVLTVLPLTLPLRGKLAQSC